MPSTSEVHIDAPLTNFAKKLGVGGGMIADEWFPIITVKKVSGKYFIISRDEEISDDFETETSDHELANEADWSLTTADYSAKTYRLRHFVSKSVMDNADSPIKPLQNATTMLVGKLRLGTELRIEALSNDDSVLEDTTPGVKWDASSAVVIEKDIDTVKESVAIACGHEPNTILIPSPIAKVVKRDGTVRELIKYTQNDLLVNGDLPPTLWNMKVLIPGSLQNTANPGQAAVAGRAWNSGNVVVAFIDPNPGIETASFGYQFSPTGQQARYAVTRYTEPGKRGQWVEVALMNAEKVVSTECVHILKSVLT